MTSVDALRPFIAPLVSACPDPTMDHHVVMAAREFCERTRVWRVVDAFEAAGTETEALAVPSNATLFEIEDVWLDGRHLERDRFSSQQLGGSGMPDAFTQARPNTLMLVPPGIGSLRVSMFVKPAIGADTLPDFLIDQHAQAIADGALARLFMIPGQSWTNPQFGSVHRAAFDVALNRNFSFGARGQHRASVRSRYRFL